MKLLTSAVVVLGLASALGACGSSDKKSAAKAPQDCPKKAGANASYSSKFEGSVSMDKSKHVLSVTRDGKPVSGANVCVNAAMIGMSSMHYSARAHELAPGRYEVGVKFGMKGDYRGNVVTKQGGAEVSTPVTVKVGSAGASSKMNGASGKMKDGMKSDGK